MTTSPLISPETLATEDQLWLFAEFFRNNWSDPVLFSKEYKTNVVNARSKAEQRFGLTGRPLHSIEYQILAGGRGSDEAGSDKAGSREVSALMSIASRYSMARSVIPVMCDETISDSFAGSGDSSISCDTRFRRFEAGKRIIIVSGDMTNKREGPYYDRDYDIHTAVISSFTESSIVFDEALPSNMPKGSRVYPTIEAMLQFETSGEVLTDSVITMRLSAVEESLGPTQLAGSIAIGGVPSGVAEYDGLPIYDPDYDYGGSISWGVSRLGEREDSGLGSETTVYGTRGLLNFRYSIRALSREQAWVDVQMFDSRGGRQKAFWFIPPTKNVYGDIAVFGTQAIVSVAGNDIDWQDKPYVYFRKTDGSLYIRRITAFLYLNVSDRYLITLDEAHPEGVVTDDIEGAGIAVRSRFDQDRMQEAWLTTEIMESRLSVTEVENEKDVNVANLVDLITSDLESAFIAGNCSGELEFDVMLSPCDGCGQSYVVAGEASQFGAGNYLRLSTFQWNNNISVAKGALFKPAGGEDVLEGYYQDELTIREARRVAFRALNAGTTTNTQPSWVNMDCGETLMEGSLGTGILWERTNDCVLVTPIVNEPIDQADPNVDDVYESCEGCLGPSCVCETTDDADVTLFGVKLCAGQTGPCISIDDFIADYEIENGVVICGYLTGGSYADSSCGDQAEPKCPVTDLYLCYEEDAGG